MSCCPFYTAGCDSNLSTARKEFTEIIGHSAHRMCGKFWCSLRLQLTHYRIFYSFQMNERNSGGDIRINLATQDVAGVYVCEAKNAAGSVTAEATVVVLVSRVSSKKPSNPLVMSSNPGYSSSGPPV